MLDYFVSGYAVMVSGLRIESLVLKKASLLSQLRGFYLNLITIGAMPPICTANLQQPKLN